MAVQSGNGSVQDGSTRLHAMLSPAVERHGLFLEEVEVRISGPHRTVQVVVDLPETHEGSVSLDQIAEVSQSLSQVLDEDPHDDGRPYSLEVTSPGVARPLTAPRHWRRNRGRMVSVVTGDGVNISGRLVEVDDAGITVRPSVEVKKGMKPRTGEPVTVPFDTIRKGTVQVEFARPDAGDSDGEGSPVADTPAQEA
jgi:ribosome maturation factor RimP